MIFELTKEEADLVIATLQEKLQQYQYFYEKNSNPDMITEWYKRIGILQRSLIKMDKGIERE